MSDDVPIRISRVAGTALYEVRLGARTPTGVILELLSKYIVDTSKGWSVISTEGTNGVGVVLSTRAVTYEQVVPNIWLPTKRESKIHRGQDVKIPSIGGQSARRVYAPPSERLTQITDYEVNSPTFSEDVFKVTLEPGTFVSDNRFKGHYRIGGEAKTDADLRDLATHAREENFAANAALNRPLPAEPPPAPRPPPMQPNPTAPARRWRLIGFNLALLAVAAGLAIWRLRYRKPNQETP